MFVELVMSLIHMRMCCLCGDTVFAEMQSLHFDLEEMMPHGVKFVFVIV
jgi:hypothetical protein